MVNQQPSPTERESLSLTDAVHRLNGDGPNKGKNDFRIDVVLFRLA